MRKQDISPWRYAQQWFLGHDAKVTGNKRNNRRAGLGENFKISCLERHYNRVKRRPTEWEKIFAYHVSDNT